VRPLLAAAALAAQLALSGCDTDGPVLPSARSLAPLSPAMLGEIEKKNMAVESPIVVRI